MLFVIGSISWWRYCSKQILIQFLFYYWGNRNENASKRSYEWPRQQPGHNFSWGFSSGSASPPSDSSLFLLKRMCNVRTQWLRSFHSLWTTSNLFLLSFTVSLFPFFLLKPHHRILKSFNPCFKSKTEVGIYKREKVRY